MKGQHEIDPRHRQVQGALRAVGPVVAGAGLVLVAVGLIDFFRSFGTMEFPRYFPCAIVGLPDENWGEVVGAFIRPRDPNAPPTVAELRPHVRAHLSPQKHRRGGTP